MKDKMALMKTGARRTWIIPVVCGVGIVLASQFRAPQESSSPIGKARPRIENPAETPAIARRESPPAKRLDAVPEMDSAVVQTGVAVEDGLPEVILELSEEVELSLIAGELVDLSALRSETVYLSTARE